MSKKRSTSDLGQYPPDGLGWWCNRAVNGESHPAFVQAMAAHYCDRTDLPLGAIRAVTVGVNPSHAFLHRLFEVLRPRMVMPLSGRIVGTEGTPSPAVFLSRRHPRVLLASVHMGVTGGAESRYVLLGVGTNAAVLRALSTVALVEDALARPEQRYTWDDLILPDDVCAPIRAAVEGFMENRALYKRLQVPFRLGLLVIGPPGNGKTLLGKILASVYRMHVEEFLTPRDYAMMTPGYGDTGVLHGEVSQSIATTPPVPRSLRLALCEDMARVLTESRASGTPAVLNVFLNKVDGLHEMSDTLLYATANTDSILDPAVLRRFDYAFRIPMPDLAARTLYLQRKLQEEPGVPFGWSTSWMAHNTEGFSYAALERLVIRCKMDNIRGETGSTERSLALIGQLALTGCTGQPRKAGFV